MTAESSRAKETLSHEPAPKNDPYSGVALLLSDRVAKCVMHKGNNGSSRIAYARIRAKPCNLFVIGAYLPHSHRHSSPLFADTLKQLEAVLSKVRVNDGIIFMGDLNCKLAKNTPGAFTNVAILLAKKCSS